MNLFDKEKLKSHFTKIYDSWYWGMGQRQSRSGLGSTELWSNSFKDTLLKSIITYDVKNILDCSCGDWNWMRTISDKLPNYTGLDVVNDAVVRNNELYSNDKIKFICSDMNTYMENQLDKSFDLIIIRHTLEHLPLDYCKQSLINAKRISKRMYITSFSEKIENIELNIDNCDYRPIYLGSDPFSEILGSPKEILYDSIESPKLDKNYSQMWFFQNEMK